MQDWSGMTEAPGGRFCQSCNQTVTDFSRMTDAALLAWLQHHTADCGRFRDDQLGRAIAPTNIAASNYWKRLMIGIGLMIAAQKDAGAQESDSGPGLRMEQLAVDMPVLDAHPRRPRFPAYNTEREPYNKLLESPTAPTKLFFMGFIVSSHDDLIPHAREEAAGRRLPLAVMGITLKRIVSGIGLRPLRLRRFFGFGRGSLDVKIELRDTKLPVK
jgi:hypothetical protein